MLHWGQDRSWVIILTHIDKSYVLGPIKKEVNIYRFLDPCKEFKILESTQITGVAA